MPRRETPFPRFEERARDAAQTGWRPGELGEHETMARLRMQLRPGPEAAGEGRHALDQLRGTLPDDQLDELRLVATELLTNSVRHGSANGGWIVFEVELYANAVRLVVTDRGPGFRPEPNPQPHPDRPGGWGLCLIDRLADRWGVDANGETSVWCELDRGLNFASAA